MPKTLPLILQGQESVDIGSDSLTGVNDVDSRPLLAFSGRLSGSR
jgi:arylsulfatase